MARITSKRSMSDLFTLRARPSTAKPSLAPADTPWVVGGSPTLQAPALAVYHQGGVVEMSRERDPGLIGPGPQRLDVGLDALGWVTVAAHAGSISLVLAFLTLALEFPLVLLSLRQRTVPGLAAVPIRDESA